MSTETIYIDESGNTGQDLLNEEQKVFVLASNNFSIDALNELSLLFSNNSELHFYKLKNSEQGRAALIKFINHPLISEENIICSIDHKELCTVGQLVDQIMEPVFYDNGIDIYKNGYNISLTNVIFHFGNFYWDKALFKDLLNSFLKMMRTKTPDSVSDFYEKIVILYHLDTTIHNEILDPLISSRYNIENVLGNVNKFTIDNTLSSFYVLCDLWHKKTDKKLNIFHDNSKQISHYKEYIEFTKTLDIPKQEIGFGNRKMTFPTQIESLELVDSQNHLGVQISDLIASTLTFMFNNKKIKHEKFVNEIKKSRLLNLHNSHTIWPRSDISPKDLGMENGSGQNVLDFLAIEMKKNSI
ncbi:MAG TPA: DUF3800 domain-containing protein [Leadbetterella sp.]|nr:DUF3800 domain-containing protein [Leadbetterella sp.]